MKTFQSAMHEHGHSCRCLWSHRIKGSSFTIESCEVTTNDGYGPYSVLVQTEADTGGWEVYMAGRFIDIDATVNEVAEHARKS